MAEVSPPQPPSALMISEQSGGGAEDRDQAAPPVSNGSGVDAHSSEAAASPLAEGSEDVRARRDADSPTSARVPSMFDQLLESHPQGSSALYNYSITYLGESFPLAMFLEDLRGERLILNHPGTPRPVDKQAVKPTRSSRSHSPTMRPEELALLETIGALTAPANLSTAESFSASSSCQDPLDIAQRHMLRRRHTSCTVPGSTAGPRRVGSLVYSETKVLFDDGYETVKISLLQVAILVSFCGGGPNDIWNFISGLAWASPWPSGLGRLTTNWAGLGLTSRPCVH
ncbi:hypothetical protein CMUS01_07999 [Colletotrichum musicola]|uniref:Uncharacterized protein n=1 Tax=Colletotrichum musicola TaxID=2175873 RepID=A0A8H6KDX9_9PEZI|nr:hypothetical protein CMUS01_07999 [Colletotrichum musicola]